MDLLRKNQLAILVSLMLTACAGGKGGFDTNTVVKDDDPEPKKIIRTYTPQVDPHNQNPSDSQAMTAPGYQLAIFRRNQARYTKDGATYPLKNGKAGEAEEYVAINPADIKPITERNFKANRDFQHLSIGFENYNSGNNFETVGEKYKPYISRVGHTGTLHYYVENPTTELALKGQITYKGIWEFLTDVDRHRNGRSVKGYSDYVGYGNDFSANSRYSDSKYESTFVADFDNKKLTGTLLRNARIFGPIENYKIEAAIKGTRFSGKATASDVTDPYLGDHADNLQGTFAGHNGEELAGHFLTNNHRGFVVFAAKHDKEDLKMLTQALRINVDAKEDFKPLELKSYGNINKLLLDGQSISLLRGENPGFTTTRTVKLGEEADSDEVTVTICCGDLNYVKFGLMDHKSPSQEGFEDYVDYEDDEEGDESQKMPNPLGKSVFIQGAVSPERNIPKTGKVNYEGSWFGVLVNRGNVVQTVRPDDLSTNDGKRIGNRSAFTADFDQKTLTGKLWRKEDAESLPAVDIQASITGASFKGTATANSAYGIHLDPGNQGGSSDVMKFTADTSGYFYGLDASELGGSFAHQQEVGEGVHEKVGVVYGAKKVDTKK
ncbi:transferrin-binding protein-like solute binding protein [Pasteurella sp. PK-2025]|uniref:transferrin-binding protein-like solute binding protein n=1 Tax=Pasteurella sp. PK-2025 TaxID=3413133 RepID=UPI003C71724A